MSSFDQQSEHFRDVLAEIFSRNVEFPPQVFVTVAQAKPTCDHKHVKVVLSVLPEQQEKAVLEIVKKSMHEIKDALAHRLRMRTIPHLHVVFDTTEAEAAKIEEAINKLNPL